MLKTDFVRELFDKLSSDYDFMNNIISFGMHKFIKEQAIKNIPVKKYFKILDVCTGTGDIAIAVSQIYGETVEITGVDFSEKMLEIFKTRTANHNNISFLYADALNLPFEDNTFDAVFISFGLRNLEDLQQGITELKRVTKNGGYLANLDTGKPKGILGVAFKIYLFLLVPFMGKLLHGNSMPYRYFFDSIEDFPAQENLVELFYESGFQEVRNYNYAFGAIAQQIAIK